MKKIVFLIAIMAILFACVPAPVKAQDPAHEYVVATATTPIGRYLNVAQKNFISVQATGNRYQITSSFPSTATMASIISDGHYVAQTGVVGVSAISAHMLPAATATYNLGSSTYKWQDLFLSRNALIGGTLGVTGATTMTTINGTTSITSPSVTASTTLTLAGTTNTVTKTSGDANSVTFSHSVAVTDTAVIPTATITKANVTTLNATGVTTLTGAFYIANVIKNVTPTAKTVSGTLSAANMIAGVIAVTNTVAVTLTTPTATAIAALITGVGQGTQFDLVIDNSASSVAGTVTLALDGSITIGTGVLTGGNTLTVAYGTVGKFSFYFTSGTTANCYRIF